MSVWVKSSKTADGESFAIAIDGKGLFTVTEGHPNFAPIKAELGRCGHYDGRNPCEVSDEDWLVDLIDAKRAISRAFEHLSERVTVRGSKVFLDLKPVDNSITQQILRMLDEGSQDWKPLALFMEHIANHPDPKSVEQIYKWLETDTFTLTPEGYVVGYKAVKTVNDVYYSIHSGYAVVDGKEVNGPVPNQPGSIVQMPREKVTYDPNTACSYGLHVGTYAFAKGFGGDTVLEIHINPRNIVSVPHDERAQKMRVCMYFVVGPVDKKYEEAVLGSVRERPLYDKVPGPDTNIEAGLRPVEATVKVENNVDDHTEEYRQSLRDSGYVKTEPRRSLGEVVKHWWRGR